MTSLIEATFQESRVRAVNLLSQKTLPILYVEGGSDRFIFHHHMKDCVKVTIPEKGDFGGMNYKKGGKRLVIQKVNKDPNSFGYVDMDHDFKSSDIRSIDRIQDSSPSACLVSHLLNYDATTQFIKNEIEIYIQSSPKMIDEIIMAAKIHSLFVWYRGFSGDKGDKNNQLDNEAFWDQLLNCDSLKETEPIFDSLTNGNKLRLFQMANKKAISHAKFRDHSLVEAIARYVQKIPNISQSINKSAIERKMVRIAQKQELTSKLLRFHQTIQAVTL